MPVCKRGKEMGRKRETETERQRMRSPAKVVGDTYSLGVQDQASGGRTPSHHTPPHEVTQRWGRGPRSWAGPRRATVHQLFVGKASGVCPKLTKSPAPPARR